MAVGNSEIRNEGGFEAEARRVVTKIVFDPFLLILRLCS